MDCSRPDCAGRGHDSRVLPFRLLASTIVLCLVSASIGRARAGGRNLDGVVNLNTAPAELLTLLPGIGPAKARGIVTYRLRRPFRTVDELVRVKGIGRRMVREIRSHLAVAGPSTAHGLPGTRIADPIPMPMPAAPTPSARLACRPAAAPPSTGPNHGRNGFRAPPVRSPANHCVGPP